MVGTDVTPSSVSTKGQLSLKTPDKGGKEETDDSEDVWRIHVDRSVYDPRSDSTD